MKKYFITGATGAIGAALVPILLEDADTRVSLLIRAKDQSHLNERLAGLMDFWGYSSNEPNVSERITPLMGDVTLPNFGLSQEVYQKISNECTHIIHSAGIVRMNLRLEEARRSAVDSAHQILDLARICQKNGNLQKAEFVSTVGVGGKMPGTVPETWITQKREFHNTYEEAKAEAELLVKDAVENGLPVTVHRPSMVVGDSKTGRIIHFQIFYYICEFLSGQRTFGLIPRIKKAKLDIIPVDYVAEVIKWSSNSSDTEGEILHLCSGPEKSIPIDQLGRLVRNIFKSEQISLPIPLIMPTPLFRVLIRLVSLMVNAKKKKALGVLPIYFDYLSELQFFEAANTDAKMFKVGIEKPDPRDCLETIIRSYLKNSRNSN